MCDEGGDPMKHRVKADGIVFTSGFYGGFRVWSRASRHGDAGDDNGHIVSSITTSQQKIKPKLYTRQPVEEAVCHYILVSSHYLSLNKDCVGMA